MGVRAARAFEGAALLVEIKGGVAVGDRLDDPALLREHGCAIRKQLCAEPAAARHLPSSDANRSDAGRHVAATRREGRGACGTAALRTISSASEYACRASGNFVAKNCRLPPSFACAPVQHPRKQSAGALGA
jgi:hypothetical protein